MTALQPAPVQHLPSVHAAISCQHGGGPPYTASPCHWDCADGQVTRRAQQSCNAVRDGTLCHPRLALPVSTLLGRTGYRSCSKARRLLTRSTSPGGTSLRPNPFPTRPGALIKADCCSPGSRSEREWPQPVLPPRCKSSFGPRSNPTPCPTPSLRDSADRFQKA
jgi:hypothetical protein